MNGRLNGYRKIAGLFWVLASVAILVWGLLPRYVVGWDLHVYGNALNSLRAGHDPYSDGIAVQRIFHAHLAENRGQPTPFTYVYSPATLPLLRLIAWFPLWLSNTAYWVVYGCGALAAVFVGLWTAEGERERRVFTMLAPAAVFFPGLLENDVLFSGNVAYILYGAALAAAWVGWRRGRWGWFYAVVFAASFCKAPMLTLLAIPVFSARRQWWPALGTGAAGLVCFAVQPLLWPTLFRHYLEAVELQFSFNHDFSSSPAGLVADALYDYVPYGLTSAGFYLVYAIGFAVLLYLLSQRYFAGLISLKQWIPVLLVGVMLLNPRIMEYDIGPMTLPMALILWRFLSRGIGSVRAAVLGLALFGALNAAAARVGDISHWRPTACMVMVSLFGLGVWDLFTSGASQAEVWAEGTRAVPSQV